MIQLVKKYLDLNRFSNLRTSFEEHFSSHPNYPSIYAITDTFKLLSIENVAIKVPTSQLDALPEHFIASINNDELVLVKKKSNIIILENGKGIKNKLGFPDFIEIWNGVIIAIEPNKLVSKKEDTAAGSAGLLFGIPLIALLVLSLFFNGLQAIHVVFILTTIIGCIGSVFIIQEKLGIKNEVTAKFCNLSAKTSCESVLQSGYGKINKWVSFSDLPLVFFATHFLSLLLFPASTAIIGLVSLVTIPIILYAIFMQQFVIGQWCMLCLFISLIIAIQAVLFLVVINTAVTYEFKNLFFYLISLIVVSTIWFWIRPILEDKTNNITTISTLKRFKRKYEFFQSFLKKIPIFEGFNELEGVYFGDRNVPIILTLIISPSCSYCDKTFQEAYALFKQYPEKVGLHILYNINHDNHDNPYTIVARRVFDLNRTDKNKAQQALIDWHIKKAKLKGWNKKWDLAAIESHFVDNHLLQQYNWSNVNEFNYTPVIIINHELYPAAYEISELQYFFNDIITNHNVVNDTVLVEA
jgi:uncharacterized membrane protein